MKNNRELGPKDKVVRMDQGNTLFIDLNQSHGNAFLVVCDKNQVPLFDLVVEYDTKEMAALLRTGDSKLEISGLDTGPGTGRISFSAKFPKRRVKNDRTSDTNSIRYDDRDHNRW